MTIICLCVPPDTIASGWWKGIRNDHNLSLPTSRLTVPEWQKAQNDHNLSLRVCHSTCEIWMTKGAEFVSARLPLDSLLLNDKGRRICLCVFITQLAAPEWQRAQNLSLRVYHSTCCSWMTKGAEFVSARLSLIERADDRNLSPHVIGPAASGWQKAQKTTLVSVLSCFESYRWQKKVLKVWDQMVPACHRAHRLWMT